jgi:carbamoyltransferase
MAAGWDRAAVIVLDGRGERTSGLLGLAGGSDLELLRSFSLPHSLGLWYEGLTEHLGFRRASDEYKVMALASYGVPRFLPRMRQFVHADEGVLRVERVPWTEFCARRPSGEVWEEVHADLAASVQACLQETVLALATWLQRETAARRAVLAGGVALNCVNNTWLLEHGPFEELWVQPAAGDAGTALGAAMRVAADLGDPVAPMATAALGPEWDDDAIEAALGAARVPAERPGDLAAAVADVIAADGVVAWFQGRSEFGPRALGHRSLLANATKPGNVERLNDVKGREQFRPVAPMVALERAAEIFQGGPIPSPYMLFTHRVAPAWRARIPAVVHVDGTARPQTVDRRDEPLVARLLDAVDARLGVPVVVNTSLNTADRPIVNDPRDALECFGSAPVDVMAIGPFLVRRPA